MVTKFIHNNGCIPGGRSRISKGGEEGLNFKSVSYLSLPNEYSKKLELHNETLNTRVVPRAPRY